LAHHLGMVLGYQLHNVSDNHDLHLAVFGNGLTAYLGQHKALARAGRQNDQRVGRMTIALKPFKYRINRLLLVGS
jgi:hypothetical protein